MGLFGRLLGRLFGGSSQETEEQTKARHAAEAAANGAFDSEKQAALEKLLGRMDDTVLHAIIPFFLGGGLDLYPFSGCIPGTVFVTQELITLNPKERPKKNVRGHFELCACVPPSIKRDDPASLKLINAMLNPTARYASMASLNPGETAEIPGEKEGESIPLMFDLFEAGGGEFKLGSERFHLLLCMALHPTELAFARKNGRGAIVEKLKQAGVYPYSYLNRPPVV